jgi:hypothetical protein
MKGSPDEVAYAIHGRGGLLIDLAVHRANSKQRADWVEKETAKVEKKKRSSLWVGITLVCRSVSPMLER